MLALGDLSLADSGDPRLRLIIEMLTKTVYRPNRVEASLEAARLNPGDYPTGSTRITWAAAVPDAARREKLTALIADVVAEDPAFGQELERRLRCLPPPPSAADLLGLSAGQIRLLRGTAMATGELKTLWRT